MALAQVDPKLAMDQLWLLLDDRFQHTNGQMPAYEWEFSELTPPVHAWAVWRVYHAAHRFNRTFCGDVPPHRDFLDRCFQKLLMNFVWWPNRVDSEGNSIFEGGFLGFDTITVVDRSAEWVAGALQHADAIPWVGMFCLNLMRIALELAKEDPVHEGLAIKFFQHSVYAANAMRNMGRRGEQLWDDQDGFLYEVVRYPDGSSRKLRVRSLAGLIPTIRRRAARRGCERPVRRIQMGLRMVPQESGRPRRGCHPPD